MAGQAFQVTDALKDKKQQQDFSYSSALKTPIFTKRDRAQLILIFSAVIKVKGKPSLSYIPLVTPSAHTDIREILLSTGDEEIVENSPIDYYWGCGADGSGKNMLGIILMEVREILRQR
ncbi:MULTISPECIES: NADAR family protein [Fischerella]|nr:NADAR domain-containing protein [Fischerella muscicola]